MSLEVSWRYEFERLVHTLVVERFGEVERPLLNGLNVAPRSLARDQLGLVKAVETFGERFIVTVTLRLNRGDYFSVAESLV